MKFDVCIIGAGPSGLSAALEFLSQGAKVLLFEKSSRPGRKACGGGLTQDAFEFLFTRWHNKKKFSLKTCGPLETCRQLAVYSGNSAIYRGANNLTPSDGDGMNRFFGRVHTQREIFGKECLSVHTSAPFMHVSNRVVWQNAVLMQIKEDGAEIIDERVARVSDKFIVTENGRSIETDFVVAADGARSLVRRTLKLPSAVGIVCRQQIVESSVANDFDFAIPSVWFHYDMFGAGYGWIFPFQDELRIGCGVPAGKGAPSLLKSSFERWLSHLRLPIKAGQMQTGSIGSRYFGHRFGRVFLAGDAAGMASSVTGEGIFQALVSGREVAKEICSPSYRSEIIPGLAIQHERTFSTVSHPIIGRSLYNNARSILKIPGVSQLAMRKFS
ncbi:MAG: NAD(P)/FAD-dependent oxidoreductase [Deltaproteobacteria bacterium]|nr:NAD(P)/FAD-dependent oxidoreductase [Deltaproteobacteria bacterium]